MLRSNHSTSSNLTQGGKRRLEWPSGLNKKFFGKDIHWKRSRSVWWFDWGNSQGLAWYEMATSFRKSIRILHVNISPIHNYMFYWTYIFSLNSGFNFSPTFVYAANLINIEENTPTTQYWISNQEVPIMLRSIFLSLCLIVHVIFRTIVVFCKLSDTKIYRISVLTSRNNRKFSLRLSVWFVRWIVLSS